MKLSLSWLLSYVPVQTDAHELAHRLTMAGLEVEAVYDRYEFLKDVVVAKVIDVIPHPDAKKLSLCTVDTGKQTLKVVCGAPNVREGMFSALVLPGAVLPGGLEIRETEIRGQRSCGMLASEKELGLGSDDNGIMLLDEVAESGTPLAAALGLSDYVFEIGLTPNRPDCLGIIGIAREVAALYGISMSLPHDDTGSIETGADIRERTSVAIEAPTLCPRYAARMIEGVSVGPSPFWLQDRLVSVGIRPVNNIVDVTNFVMMETGQPLHAFDYDELEEGRIVVRTALHGDRFTTLDGKERILASENLMICDGKKPVAIGGIMGGLNSEISETTTRVLIESAYFNPVSIRKTAKQLGISTDASHRFERGIDPEGTVHALNRAAFLIYQVAGGVLLSGLIDAHPVHPETRTISLPVKRTNQILGVGLNAEEMKSYLESISFTVHSVSKDSLSVTPPFFRVDVTRPEDLMEEVARLHGYDNIPVTFPAITSPGRKDTFRLDIRRQIREILTGFGLTETVNYAFSDDPAPDRLCLPEEDHRRNRVKMRNPLTEEHSGMRTELISGMMFTLRRNLSHQLKNLGLFEIGKTFIQNAPGKLPVETEMVAAMYTGNRIDGFWDAKDTPYDFYDIKGLCEGLLNGLGIQDFYFAPVAPEFCYYSGKGAAAWVGKSLPLNESSAWGVVSEMNPEVVKAFDVRQPVFFMELDFEKLLKDIPGTKQAQPVPRFPSVTRDITLILEKDKPAGNILRRIYEIKDALVEDVFLFDVYTGKGIREGRKSLSLRIVYRSLYETLSDEQVMKLHRNMTDTLVREFQAELPG